MGKTRKPRDFLMKRKDAISQKKPRPPQTQRVLSPMGMLEVMKRKNPKEFAQALRNLKKTCMVCENTYYGQGTPHEDGVICLDCMDCFAGEPITDQTIEIVRKYRKTKDGRTRVEKFADTQNNGEICPKVPFSNGEAKTDTEHSGRDETTQDKGQTTEEKQMDD